VNNGDDIADLEAEIKEKKGLMMEAVDNEEYEDCARYRDEIKQLKQRLKRARESSGSGAGPAIDERAYKDAMARIKSQLKEAKINEEFELCVDFKKQSKVRLFELRSVSYTISRVCSLNIFCAIDELLMLPIVVMVYCAFWSATQKAVQSSWKGGEQFRETRAY